MRRHIRNPAAYNAAVERSMRPWPGGTKPQPDEVSVTWTRVMLENLAAEDVLADKPTYLKALAEAARLVAQHEPVNLAALEKLALGDTAIRILVEKAGLKVKSASDLEKVRRLLLVAAATAKGPAA